MARIARGRRTKRTISGNGDVDRKEVIAWLRDALAQAHAAAVEAGRRPISQAELARQIGVRRDVITNILQGRRAMKSDEMVRIAKVLGIDPPKVAPATELTQSAPADTPREIDYVWVVGEVAAGVFRDMYVEDFEPYQTPIPADPRWPPDALRAYVVRGESINRQAHDGDLVIILDVAHAPRDPQTGDWVIAERTRGDLRETTVKRVKKLDGDLYLCPDSTDERFQPIKVGTYDGEVVRVIGFVLNFVREGTRL